MFYLDDRIWKKQFDQTEKCAGIEKSSSESGVIIPSANQLSMQS